ncbi:MAG: carbohydrate ABC transporter permease [Rhodobacteraceae bacterium]|nr:carbohydrate ABC transporter permease [Paracoccaceae bacterium]
MTDHSHKIGFRIGMAAAGLLIGFYVLFPIFWLFLASFKGAAELNSLPVSFWPQEPTLDAYRDLFASGTQSAQLLDWRRLIVNSFFVAITSTIIVLVLGTFAGFAFARMNFPGRDVILGSLLISRMFQGAALLLPTSG